MFGRFPSVCLTCPERYLSHTRMAGENDSRGCSLLYKRRSLYSLVRRVVFHLLRLRSFEMLTRFRFLSGVVYCEPRRLGWLWRLLFVGRNLHALFRPYEFDRYDFRNGRNPHWWPPCPDSARNIYMHIAHSGESVGEISEHRFHYEIVGEELPFVRMSGKHESWSYGV